MRDKSKQLRKRLAKKVKKGFRRFPLATIAAYGLKGSSATMAMAQGR